MEKSRKLSVLEKRARRKIIKGFTLIELMIVIAIIAILASIAIPQYMRYQEKSKVTSYALPVARGCAMDIIGYCVEHPGAKSVNFTVLPNCKSPVSTEAGQVTLEYLNDNLKCNDNGRITIDIITIDIGDLPIIPESYFALEYSPNLFNIFRSFIGVPVAFASVDANNTIISDTNALVIAKLQGIDSYVAVCEYEKESLKCYVTKDMDRSSLVIE